jgi:hypothetical protein
LDSNYNTIDSSKMVPEMNEGHRSEEIATIKRKESRAHKR